MRTILVIQFSLWIAILSGSPTLAELDPVKSQATVDAVMKLLKPYHTWSAFRESEKVAEKLKEIHGPAGKPFIRMSVGTPFIRMFFDVQSLFSVLPRLSMEEGYRLDFVLGGDQPLIYARDLRAAPFDIFSEFTDSIPQPERRTRLRPFEFNNPVSWGCKFYVDKLRTDGTDEGFFQLLVLHLMGDQFLLYWHALYHDELIICSKSGLDQLFAKADAEVEKIGRGITNDVRRAAYALDLKPKVQREKGRVTVQVVVFTKWGGFEKRSYTFSERAPHRLVDGKKEELVRYHCGFVF